MVKEDSSQHSDITALYVSAEELALMFKPPLSVRFIRDLQKRRTIPWLKLGRRVLFDPVRVKETLAGKLTIHPRGSVSGKDSR